MSRLCSNGVGGERRDAVSNLPRRRVVGGAEFAASEDREPPDAVSALRLAVVGTRAVLTFDPVVREAKTGLRERVAYYEILRDGKAVTRVIRDEDPIQPGMQWSDPEPLQYGT